MHIEFEDVEELVRDKVDCAITFFFDPEAEGERCFGLEAGWEGDVLQCACAFVLDVLA